MFPDVLAAALRVMLHTRQLVMKHDSAAAYTTLHV